MPIAASSVALVASCVAPAGSSDSFVTAVVAGIVSLTVAGLSNFGAESFRRHRDATALASGLAGELASLMAAVPLIKSRFSLIAQHIEETGERVSFPPFAIPTDPVFDSCAGNLGALGPALAEDVAFVYISIRAFRQVMATVSDPNASAQQQVGGISAGLEAIERASSRATALIPALRRLAMSQWLEIDAK